MAVAITVPRLGWSMEEGTFVEWRKQDGERIEPGEILFVLESEKAAEEIAALDGGILHIPPDAPQPGDTVKVGQLLGYVLAEGEPAPAKQLAPPVAEPVSVPVQVLPSEADPMPSRKLASSPRARRVAAQLGVDWTLLKGSGHNGRIRERDVRSAVPSVIDGRLIPHTNLRRTIASHMVAGVTQAAPVTLTMKVSAANLVNLRGQFKAAAVANDIVPGYTDVLLKLAAVALRQHPLLQAQWRDNGLFVPEHVNIAFAVDTESGLLAPVVRGVAELTVRQVAAQTHQLIDLGRAGRLTAEQMRDATFTVTNLGSLGIDAFTPIIHLPQSAVLGIGRIIAEPVVDGDKIVPGKTLTLSLTFDHRVVDGAPAPRFLNTLRDCIENPAPWLIS